MSLPKIKHPTFDAIIPSTNEKIRMRSMTASEFKLLHIAKETNNTRDIVNAAMQVINNCVVDSGFDVDKLKTFDLEKLYLDLYISSLAEAVKTVKYKCKNEIVETESGKKIECGNINKVIIPLKDAKLPELKEGKLKLGVETDQGQAILLFEYPTVLALKEEYKNDFDYLVSCLISITIGDDVNIKGKDFTVEEAIEFVEQLDTDSLSKLSTFIDGIPKLVINKQFKCSKCGYNHDVTLEGFNDFF